MNKTVAIALALLLSACSSILPNKTTDAPQWQSVNCNGGAGWNACNSKAASLCPKGFDVGTREENMVTGSRVLDFSCRK